ncbi:MAG TPA: FAD-dependent monooxygenase [Acidimicrobiales bacterium]|nr:FAD-dependent monooxygenase [Acidimicrobiales bacterium]
MHRRTAATSTSAPSAPSAPAARPCRSLAAHAVVIGAGVAGLAAAQALSEHVDWVTVIERDDLPERPGSRAGVPQARHVHAFQAGGVAALERLLPGVGADLRAAGATPVRIPEDVLWLSPAGWIPNAPARPGHLVLSASRDLLEWTVRRRVLESPQIVVRSGLEVCGLVVRDGRARGVEVRARRAGTAGPVVTIDADLIVDAGGRRSPAPAWLRAAGAAAPTETAIDARVGYASRLLRRTPGDTPGWAAALSQARPPDFPRGGVLFPVERNAWLLTLTCAGEDSPPTDDDGFLAFAHSLRGPDIGALAARAEPLGPVVAFHRTGNVRRHYERLSAPLDGFLAVGDALCAVNPVYAQGMSMALLEAEALGRALGGHLARRRDLTGLSGGAQRAVARVADGAWAVATAWDLRYPDVAGDARGRPARARDRALARYQARVGRWATADPEVAAALYEVISLLAPPASLLRPAVARRALRRLPPRSPRPQWSAGGGAGAPAALAAG